MVFGKDYDRALWLMLAGNKDFRDTFAFNVRYLPPEVYEYIYSEIEKYSQYDEKESFETVSSSSRALTGSDGYTYRIDVEIELGKLNLSVFRKSFSEGSSSLFQVSLVPITEKELLNMKKSDCIYLGKCSWGYVKNGKDNILHNEEYELQKIPFGLMVESKYSTKYKIIDYKKYPEEMEISDFETDDKVNHLVRRRKNRKHS